TLDGKLRLLLPLVSLRLVILVALLQQTLVRDRSGYLRLDLDKLVVHIQDELSNDLLRVFGATDQVIDIRPYERRDAVEQSHDSRASLVLGPTVLFVRVPVSSMSGLR